ncbi:MAG: methyltransferase domain-containing protein [Gemmataceae bacterium]
MTARTLVRRYWPLGLIAAAIAACYPAFHYLVDFRPPDVPFVTTPSDVVAAMLDLGDVSGTDTVYDLGSGDGRIVLAAARDRGATAVGVEIDPALVDRSRAAIQTAGLTDRASVRRGDIFKQDLSRATVVMLFLKPDVNARLRSQLDTCPPGTRVVSHMFSMPGAKPAKKVAIQSTEDGLEHTLYLWVTPIEWEGK